MVGFTVTVTEIIYLFYGGFTVTVTELINITIGFDVCGGPTAERGVVTAHANFALQNAPHHAYACLRHDGGA